LFFKSYYGANRERNGKQNDFLIWSLRDESVSYHFDVTVFGVECEQISPDEVSLLIVPVNVEYKAVFCNLLHGRKTNCFDFSKV